MLIAFDIENSCSKFSSFTCNFSMLEDDLFLFIITLMLSHIFLRVCRVFKYITIIKCAIYFVDGHYFVAIKFVFIMILGVTGCQAFFIQLMTKFN